MNSRGKRVCSTKIQQEQLLSGQCMTVRKWGRPCTSALLCNMLHSNSTQHYSHVVLVFDICSFKIYIQIRSNQAISKVYPTLKHSQTILGGTFESSMTQQMNQTTYAQNVESKLRKGGSLCNLWFSIRSSLAWCIASQPAARFRGKGHFGHRKICKVGRFPGKNGIVFQIDVVRCSPWQLLI